VAAPDFLAEAFSTGPLSWSGDIVLSDDRDLPPWPPIGTTTLSAAAVAEHLAVVADADATEDGLLQVPVAHPQLFLQMTRRPALSALLSLNLAAVAAQGPGSVVQPLVAGGRVRIELLTWVRAAFSIPGLEADCAAAIAATAGMHLARGTLLPGAGVSVADALHTCPAITERAIAALLTAVMPGPGWARAGRRLFTDSCAQLISDRHPIAVLAARDSTTAPGEMTLVARGAALDRLPPPIRKQVLTEAAHFSGRFPELLERCAALTGLTRSGGGDGHERRCAADAVNSAGAGVRRATDPPEDC
jgi:hypothetical protein